MSKSIASFIQQMQEITARAESNIITKIGVVDNKIELTNNRIDKMAEYMVAENKEIKQRLAQLEEHITQPTQKCEAPKSVNTVQYNNAAQQVQPIGTCKVWNKEASKWDVVNFFGFCKTCGDPILSPSVIAYCTVNKLDVNCYPCQKGKKRTAKYMDITMANGRAVNSTPTQAPVDTSLTVKCDVCGKPRKYKSSDDYLAKKKYAESLGLPGTMCTECARKALDELNAEVATPKYEDPIAFEKQRREDKAKARMEVAATQESKTISVEEAVAFFMSIGVDTEYIAEMKIAEVRQLCEESSITIGFDGREWNNKKRAVVDALDEAVIAKGKEIDEAIHPMLPVQEVIDVEFVEEDSEINQGF